jgi:hypothetical protein
MRIVDVIESLSCDKARLTPNQLGQIVNQYTDNEWACVDELFLRGIGREHQVPGKVVDICMGIGDFYRETQMLTHKQKIWLLDHLIKHWNQVGVVMRGHLML